MTYPLVRLDKCARIVSGATPSTSKTEYWNGDIRWVTPADLGNLDSPFISETPRTITKAGLADCAAEILPAYSVLFSSRAPIGHVAINTEPMATNQGFKSFVPIPNRLDTAYLYHWLRANRSFLESQGNGATFKEVSKSVVARIEIPLPPIVDQRRIAAILAQADDLRRKRREALNRLRNYPTAILKENRAAAGKANRNATCQLGDLVRDDDRINYGVVQPGPEVDDGIPLIRVENVVNNNSTEKTLNTSLRRLRRSIEGHACVVTKYLWPAWDQLARWHSQPTK